MPCTYIPNLLLGLIAMAVTSARRTPRVHAHARSLATADQPTRMWLYISRSVLAVNLVAVHVCSCTRNTQSVCSGSI